MTNLPIFFRVASLIDISIYPCVSYGCIFVPVLAGVDISTVNFLPRGNNESECLWFVPQDIDVNNHECLLCTWWRHQMEHFPRYWTFVRGIRAHYDVTVMIRVSLQGQLILLGNANNLWAHWVNYCLWVHSLFHNSYVFYFDIIYNHVSMRIPVVGECRSLKCIVLYSYIINNVFIIHRISKVYTYMYIHLTPLCKMSWHDAQIIEPL